MKAAFTICTPTYLPYAKSLGDSIIEHNPDYVFYIFYFDIIPTELNASFFSPLALKQIENLGIPSYFELRERYNDFELCCALKPYIAEYILKNEKKVDAVFYFDSDILVFNSFEFSEEALSRYPILITPHILESIKEDDFFPKEENIIRSGFYNAGFFAVTNQEISLSFLSWWKQRLFTKCYVKLDASLFVDQIWLTSAVHYFPQIYVLRHPGYNFAYWNFQERDLSKVNGKFVINKSNPLVFMHYSGFDLNKPDDISKHQNRFSFQDKPETKELFEKYINDVLKNNINDLLCFEALPTEKDISRLKRTKNKILNFFSWRKRVQ